MIWHSQIFLHNFDFKAHSHNSLIFMSGYLWHVYLCVPYQFPFSAHPLQITNFVLEHRVSCCPRQPQILTLSTFACQIPPWKVEMVLKISLRAFWMIWAPYLLTSIPSLLKLMASKYFEKWKYENIYHI